MGKVSDHFFPIVLFRTWAARAVYTVLGVALRSYFYNPVLHALRNLRREAGTSVRLFWRFFCFEGAEVLSATYWYVPPVFCCSVAFFIWAF
uniref:Uncharacterized protein n=1 Tax=Anopheles darlingi TaxID=43151 RepID=A0A2M4D0A8_ANODA